MPASASLLHAVPPPSPGSRQARPRKARCCLPAAGDGRDHVRVHPRASSSFAAPAAAFSSAAPGKSAAQAGERKGTGRLVSRAGALGGDSQGSNPNVSVIVPIYNEVENVPALVDRIASAMKGAGHSYEIVLVDDGSRDGSGALMQELAAGRSDLTAITFRRNFGQTAAMAAGFAEAAGGVFVTLDGDLQNDPSDIPRLLEELLRGGEAGEGYDMVCGWRRQRKDNVLLRNFPSYCANRLIARVTGVRLHDYGCSLKAYRADVGRMLRPYGELHRYLPALAHIHGARISEVEVMHRAREKGVSKYSALGRTPRVVMDLLTVYFMSRFLDRPMHAIGLLGFSSVAMAALGAAALATSAAVAAAPGPMAGAGAAVQAAITTVATGPAVLVAVVALAGLQLLCLGVVAEVASRTYFESQGLTRYRIRHLLRAPSAAAWL